MQLKPGLCGVCRAGQVIGPEGSEGQGSWKVCAQGFAGHCQDLQPSPMGWGPQQGFEPRGDGQLDSTQMPCSIWTEGAGPGAGNR